MLGDMSKCGENSATVQVYRPVEIKGKGKGKAMGWDTGHTMHLYSHNTMKPDCSNGRKVIKQKYPGAVSTGARVKTDKKGKKDGKKNGEQDLSNLDNSD